MKKFLDFRSLSVQMILSFVGVVILTSAAVGLPAILLIRNELDHQARLQLEQGKRAVLALYQATRSEVEDYASLTAQRPTLHELLSQDNQEELNNYLNQLRGNAGLDLIAVCGSSQSIRASSESFLPLNPCITWESDGYQILSIDTHQQIWLSASYPITDDLNGTGKVIVGRILDDDFAVQMHDHTGLEHTIWSDHQPVATSLETDIAHLESLNQQRIPLESSEETVLGKFELMGNPYYSALIQLESNGIAAEVVLNVAEITATQSRMVWIISGSIVIVVIIGSAIGILLARRISKPLVRLAGTAEEFREGDLSSPVDVDENVREVSQVANALESARIDIQRTLTNLEQEKAWVNLLLESIVEGIMTLNQEWRITYFSKGAERITGWNRDEVIGRLCDEVFRSPEMEASFSQLIPAYGSRNKLLVELANGKQATLAVTRAHLAPSDVGDAETVLVFRDISEEEIIHRILGDFLANIVHEFRTPLSAAAASIELLIDEAPNLSETELKELLNSLHLGILGLQTLIDNLLESASIEAGRFRISRHQSDLGEIIANAIQTMQPLLDKYSQRLVIELPTVIPLVYADDRRIEQVLINLLSNAIKFSPTEMEISIRVASNEKWVKVEVVDRGPGIALDQREYIFRRFMSPSSLSDSAKVGAGLGLSVVKAVVEAHGGQVGVDDRPGGGSSFWFTLPLVDAE